MPLYQNTSVNTEKLILGNYKIETAASAGGSYVNLGAGVVNSFAHDIEKYDVQAGNAPDPVEGISDETFTVELELMEFDASSLAAISCGAMTKTTGGSGVTILNAGGNTTLTERAFKLTNYRLINSVTQQTVITVYYATLSTGIQITAKSDNDSDPINILPATIVGKIDGTRTAGSQLFQIEHTYNA